MKKRIIFISLIVISFAYKSISQELIEKGFKHLEGETTARVNRETDINGQPCAVLKIKHNFGDSEFEIEAGRDYQKRVDKIGETYIWISPDEYQIVIRRKGYLPFRFDLKNKLVELETYELIITNEFGIIRVDAPQAQIWLDNKLAGRNNYVFKNVKEDKYIVKATRDKYYDEEKFIILNAGDDTLLHFNLKPKIGNLIVNSSTNKTLGADVFIDDSLNGKTNITVPLIIGMHNLNVEKDGYLPFKQNVLIKENQNTLVNLQMEVDPSIQMQKYKKRRNIWLVSTIGTAGLGLYSHIKANNLYDEYLDATTNASDLHQKIETYDKIKPIAFTAAGICLVEFFIQNSKYKKAKQKVKIYPSYSQNGGAISLRYKF